MWPSAAADGTLRAMTSSTPEPIRVALLGFGFAGRIFHAPFIAATSGMRLHVVASSRRDEILAAYPDTRVVATPAEAVHDDAVDLVVVATPNELHAPLAEEALRAGKHVVVDKPFTLTLDEAHRVVDTARQADRLLSVFHNRRWDSDFLGIEQAVLAGTVGDVVEYRSEIGRWRPVVRDRWRERPGPGAGIWYDLGPHLVHQALTLFGAPDTVHAAIRALRPGATVDDWFQVRLAYPTREVLLSSSMLAADAAPRFVVRGTTGSLVKAGIDQQEARLLAGERPQGSEWGHDDDPLLVIREGEDATRVAVPRGDYGRFYAAMRDAIVGSAPVPVSTTDAITVMAITMAGFESAASGRAVRLADVAGSQ